VDFLSHANLGRVPREVKRPGYDRRAVDIGIVHFGPGAFHRVHQAWFVDKLLADDPRWGICAVSLRSTDVRDALVPQDGLYTLATLDESTSYRVIGALKQTLVARRCRSVRPRQVPVAVLACTNSLFAHGRPLSR
jgi:fructuronate reductase